MLVSQNNNLHDVSLIICHGVDINYFCIHRHCHLDTVFYGDDKVYNNNYYLI